jgi:hypothetical protein
MGPLAELRRETVPGGLLVAAGTPWRSVIFEHRNMSNFSLINVKRAVLCRCLLSFGSEVAEMD